MSGKPPMKIYEYDNKGCFIRQFETLADARKYHYSDDKGLRPVFASKKNILFGFKIHVTPSDTILINGRPGKSKIHLMYRIYKSNLCNISESKFKDKPIIMYNLKDEVIAEFANVKIAKEILDNSKYPHQTRNYQLNYRTNDDKDTNKLKVDYYFKFKD